MRLRAAPFQNSRLFPAGNASAFTLIELVISGALASLILTSAYICLSAGVSSQKMIEPRSEVFQNARVAMSIMTADLRSACPLSDESAFVGLDRELEGGLENILSAGNIDFATHHYTPRRAREGDYCQVSYFLASPGKDPVYRLAQTSGKQSASDQTQTNAVDTMDSFQKPTTLSLFRRRNPFIAADAFSGGTREEILRGVRGLKFEYYDGEEWHDTWGQTEKDLKVSGQSRKEKEDDAVNTGGLPQAVRITLYLDPNPNQKKTGTQDLVETPVRDSDSTNIVVKPTIEPPLVLETVVRLELSDRFPSATSALSTNTDFASPQPDDQPRRSDRRRGNRTGGRNR